MNGKISVGSFVMRLCAARFTSQDSKEAKHIHQDAGVASHKYQLNDLSLSFPPRKYRFGCLGLFSGGSNVIRSDNHGISIS